MDLPGGGHGRGVCLLLPAFPFPAGWGVLIMSAPCLVPPFVPSSALPTTPSLSLCLSFLLLLSPLTSFSARQNVPTALTNNPAQTSPLYPPPPFLSFIQVLFFFLNCLNFSPPFLLFWPVHPSPHLLLALVCPTLPSNPLDSLAESGIT